MYTNAKVERANGVISDTLCAFANGRKDDSPTTGIGICPSLCSLST